MNPSTSLGTRSNVGMTKPSPLVRQAAHIWRLLVIRGVYRRRVPSGCAQGKYRRRCRVRAGQLSAGLRYATRVTQVQLDELFALLSAVKAGEVSDTEAIQRLSRSPQWVWAAIDPVTKVLLTIDIGDRTLA